LLISDNLEADTTTIPLQIFARADLLSFQNKDSLAMITLDTLLTQYKSSYTLQDNVLMMKYRIAIKHQDYDKAVVYLKDIEENYSTDILADNALFYLGNIYENIFKDNVKAKEYYQKIIVDYTGSFFVIEARKRYRNLK